MPKPKVVNESKDLFTIQFPRTWGGLYQIHGMIIGPNASREAKMQIPTKWTKLSLRDARFFYRSAEIALHQTGKRTYNKGFEVGGRGIDTEWNNGGMRFWVGRDYFIVRYATSVNISLPLTFSDNGKMTPAEFGVLTKAIGKAYHFDWDEKMREIRQEKRDKPRERWDRSMRWLRSRRPGR